MTRRTWGVGVWGCSSTDVDVMHARGQEVGVVVNLRGAYVVFFRGRLLRERPFRTRALARLAVDRAYLKEVGESLTPRERESYGLAKPRRGRR